VNRSIVKPTDIPRWNTTSENASDTLSRVFSAESIKNAYLENIAWKGIRAVDRMSPAVFESHKEEHFTVIQRKCSNGTYRFAPFSERLRNRGRYKPPRVISVATMRDRIVLHLLKEYLHEVFSDCVNRKLPNEYIRNLKRFCEHYNTDDLCLYKVDIKSFYDSIDHKKLLTILRRRIHNKPDLLLIRNAIETSTVNEDHRRTSRKESLNQKGIPQGLAISNVLANIYFHRGDHTLENSSLLYLRYVDDMLLVVNDDEEAAIKSKVRTTLYRMGLEKNKEKCVCIPFCSEVDYLGYHLELPKISVKKMTVEHFLRSISALVSQYKRLGPTGMYHNVDSLVAKELFLSDLNEKITGAISENRSYGWIFYFSEMNDLPLLYGIDALIERKFLSRLTLELLPNPGAVKKLSRAYYLTKYSRLGGYIHNYDIYDTIPKKLEFLNYRGQILPGENLTETQIQRRFDQFRRRRLSDLEADIDEAS
jgi:RNA-directed DNA polymerase